MTLISGQYGAVKIGSEVASTITNWQINSTSTTNAYTASNTKGGTGRKPGMRSANGSFAGMGPIPAVLPGQRFNFVGFTGPSNGTSTGQGKLYSVPAIAESASITWDYEGRGFVNYTLNFISDGQLSVTTGASIQDTSYPIAIQPDPDKTIEIVGEETQECYWNIANATLNLNCNISTYSNTCTGGWQQASPGALDWSLSCSVQNDDITAYPFDVGDDIALRLYGDSENYWLLKWLHCREMSGLTVDIAGNGLVTFSMNFDGNGFFDEKKGVVQYGNSDEPADTDCIVFWNGN